MDTGNTDTVREMGINTLKCPLGIIFAVNMREFMTARCVGKVLCAVFSLKSTTAIEFPIFRLGAHL